MGAPIPKLEPIPIREAFDRLIRALDPPEAYSAVGSGAIPMHSNPSSFLPGRDDTFICSHCAVLFTVSTDCGCGARRPREKRVKSLPPQQPDRVTR